MWQQRAVKSNEGNDVGRPPAALNTSTSNLATAEVGFRSKLRAGVRCHSKLRKNRAVLGNPSNVVSHPMNVFE
jgi:hypothetical protein